MTQYYEYPSYIGGDLLHWINFDGFAFKSSCDSSTLSAHKIISSGTYACSLCSLTYGNLGKYNNQKKIA